MNEPKINKDYLLAAIDDQQIAVIRFLSLKNTVSEVFQIHQPTVSFQNLLLELLLSTTILGSRHDEQQTFLLKIIGHENSFRMNCEVSPKGLLRALLLAPGECLNPGGKLHIVTLSPSQQLYESIVPLYDRLESSIQEYLSQSVQTPYFFTLVPSFEKPFALWVEKLPNASLEQWEVFKKKLTPNLTSLVEQTTDPDILMRSFFGEGFRILHVSHPTFYCPCNRERFLNAIKVLPQEDLLDLFVEGEGIRSHCDYCKKEWVISDAELKEYLNLKM